jgi:hypothetical protein
VVVSLFALITIYLKVTAAKYLAEKNAVKHEIQPTRISHTRIGWKIQDQKIIRQNIPVRIRKIPANSSIFYLELMQAHSCMRWNIPEYASSNGNEYYDPNYTPGHLVFTLIISDYILGGLIQQYDNNCAQYYLNQIDFVG